MNISNTCILPANCSFLTLDDTGKVCSDGNCKEDHYERWHTLIHIDQRKMQFSVISENNSFLFLFDHRIIVVNPVWRWNSYLISMSKLELNRLYHKAVKHYLDKVVVQDLKKMVCEYLGEVPEELSLSVLIQASDWLSKLYHCSNLGCPKHKVSKKEQEWIKDDLKME